MYHIVSDFDSSFEFTNDVKNMKSTFELLSAYCTPIPARTKHVQSSERIISQFKACEFIIQILYILFLHKSRVTTLDMAWQQSWCDMIKVRPEYIIRIKIRAKTFPTKFGIWAHNFFLIVLWPILFNFSLIVTFQKRFAARNTVFSSFGQFFPVLDGKTGKNRFIPVYPILDGKNRFWMGKTQPCLHVI